MITKKNSLVQKLINLQNDTSNNYKYLTIYHTLTNLEDKIVEKEIKSVITEAFRKEGENEMYKNLVEKVNDAVIKNKEVKFGAAIFLRFDNSGNFSNEDLIIHFSKFTPETKSFIGDIFDLSSLAGMIEEEKNLFVNMSFGDTKIYKLENDNLQLISTLDNTILEKMEDRFTNVQKTSPGIGSGGVQSSSGEFQQKEDKFVRTIVNEMIAGVKQINNNPNTYDTIFIAYSNDFEIDSDHMRNELKHLSKSVITQIKNIDNEKDLKNKVTEFIEEHRSNEVEDILNQYKTKIDIRLHDEPEQVFEFLRRSNVQKLFLSDTVQKEGYLLDNSLPYLEQYPDAEHKENIIPYIVKQVLEIDGEVYLLDKEYKGNVMMVIPRY